MPKRSSGALVTGLILDRGAAAPLNRQLFEALRRAILEGHLPPGARLPSSRVLARELQVGRNTVTEAYDQLFAEGYVVGRAGAGTFVSGALPDARLRPGITNPAPPDGGEQAPRIARRAYHLAAMTAMFVRGRADGPAPPRAFQLALPDLEAFPARLWGRLVARHARDMQPWLRGLLHPAGYLPLREAIAHHLATARGVRCTPEQVFVIGGSQRGIALAAQVLVNPGEAVWMEDPGYRGARAALEGADARVVPVPVDGEGLDVRAGRAQAPEARLAYVTPSHQFPLGIVMSLRRRLELLEWARSSGAWILEDDYDSDYRYRGRPLTALQGLDGGGRVIYTGTFSKVLFPALRIGYLVVPRELVDAFAAVLYTLGAPAPTLEQLVLADFIREGHFERHLRRTRLLYEEKQAALLRSAGRSLAGRLSLAPAEAGLHLVGWLPEGWDDRLAAERAAEHGVRVHPLSGTCQEPYGRSALILGYAGVSLPELRRGVEGLKAALDSLAE